MKKIIFFFFSFFLFASDINNSLEFNKSEINKTIELLNSKLDLIEKRISKMDFYIKYKQYQQLEILNKKLTEINRKLKILKKHKYYYKDKISKLELQKTAYEQQIQIIGNGKNIFDSIISIDKLPKPFNITNPFEIFSLINYQNKIQLILNKYEKEYSEINEIIKLLKEKKEILSKLGQKDKSLDETIQNFSLIKDIYNSKLKQLKSQAAIYIEQVKEEENIQIRKLITLLVTIFISILFFTIIKLALRKYARNIDNIYLINKILNILNFTIAILIVMFFYIDNATYLITILGFASAGIAIAMKDWFMNIFGWFVIITTGNFKVGDRIKIVLQNGNIEIVGDVIDITISRIVIHEDVTLTSYIKNRRAGRIIFVPNNVVFTNPIFNYTHSGLKTVWDGIDIVITFDSNYKKAEYIAKEVVKKYSKGYTDITRIQLNRLRANYNIKNTNIEPRIFTFIGEYGIVISCWYLNSYATLNLRSKISADLIEAFNKEEDIKIAYNTIHIKSDNEEFTKTKTFI